MRKKLILAAQWCEQKLRIAWDWYKQLYTGRKWYVKVGVGFASAGVGLIVYLGVGGC